MLREVVLYGPLKHKFGEKYKFHIENPQEAVRALFATVKGFANEFMKYPYRIVIGDIEEFNSIPLEELSLSLGRKDQIHIVPFIKGSKESWVGVVIGIVIVAVAIVASGGLAAGSAGLLSGMGTTAFTVGGAAVSWGSIALLGAAIAFSGIAGMLAPDPNVNDYGSRETPDRRASFLFNGATNTIEQGGPVPVGFGRMRVGSVQISLGVQTEEVQE